MSNKTIILYESDEAAVFEERTIKGWWSSDGRYWGNMEGPARYAGSTHKTCKCGEVIPTNGYCDKCWEKNAHARYEAMESVEWDWKTPVCIHDTDMYFFHHEEIVEHCEEYGCKIEDLELVLCTPNYASQIDDEHWCDDLPEDGELPDGIKKAMRAFNEVIAKAEPLSWSAGNKRVVIKAH